MLQWKSNTQFECLSVALVKQHAKRMRHIIICGLSRSTTSYKRQDFSGKKVIERKTRDFIFSATSV